jgi:hypothetical protein
VVSLLKIHLLPKMECVLGGSMVILCADFVLAIKNVLNICSFIMVSTGEFGDN